MTVAENTLVTRQAKAVSIFGIACWVMLMLGGVTIVGSFSAPTASANCISGMTVSPPDCDEALLIPGCIDEEPESDLGWRVDETCMF